MVNKDNRAILDARVRQPGGKYINPRQFKETNRQLSKFLELLSIGKSLKSGRFIIKPEGEVRDIETNFVIRKGNDGSHGYRVNRDIPLKEKHVAALLHKNAEANHIYMMIERKDVVLLDDVKVDLVNKYISSNKKLIAVETSLDNFQLYLFSDSYELMPPDERAEFRRRMQDKNGADTGDILNKPCVRVPGFFNVKKIDDEGGFEPFMAKIFYAQITKKDQSSE